MVRSRHQSQRRIRGVFTQTDFVSSLLDTIPSVALLVDGHFRLRAANSRAVRKFSPQAFASRALNIGQVLRCTTAVVARDGCGEANPCASCPILEVVSTALDRADVFQQSIVVEREVDGIAVKEPYRATATPFQYHEKGFVLLTLDDVSRHEPTGEIVPICAQCKQIRSPEEEWDPPEVFMKARLGVDFTHTICPSCLVRLYPELQKP